MTDSSSEIRAGGLAYAEKRLNPDRLAEARDRRFGVARVHPQVFEQQPGPIWHFRVNSRYLAGQWGPITLDSRTLPEIDIRNLFINLMILLPRLTMIVLLCRLGMCWTGTNFAFLGMSEMQEPVDSLNIPLVEWVHMALSRI